MFVAAKDVTQAATDDGYYGFDASNSPIKESDQEHVGTSTPSPATRAPSLPSPPASEATTSPGSVSVTGGVSNVDEIPDVKDTSKPRPQPGVVRLSEPAMYHRMRRIFHPTGSKERRVSEELVRQWDKRGKSRTSLEVLFQSCGFNTDRYC